MKKINVFYHIFICNNSELVIEDQIKKLQKLKSENTDINFFVNITPSSDKSSLDSDLYEKILELTSSISHYPQNHFELSTLSLLYEHAKSNPDDLYLYVHTKGVTRINDKENGDYSYKNVENWRNIMEYFCIENWQFCVNKLDKYDLVGCNYIPHSILGVPAHFSGNFWWSKSEFIRSLDDPKSFITDFTDRFKAEFWVGGQKHLALCLFPVPKPIIEKHNRSFSYTPKEKYVDNITETEFQNS